MPSASLDFRVRCGLFVHVFVAFMAKRADLAKEMSVRVLRVRTRMEKVLVSLILVVFLTSDLLLLAGNVETNPGPTDTKDSGSRTVQTRLTAAGGRPNSTERRNSASAAPNQPTLADLMSKLLSMETSMDSMNRSVNSKLDQVSDDVQKMKAEFGFMQAEVQTWKDKVDALEEENEELKATNKELLERVVKIENNVDDLEGRSRRQNLLFHGLRREEGETQEILELRLREIFTDQMDIADHIEFDRVHRLGSKVNAPVIARLTFYKDKVKLLKAKKKLIGSDIFIGEDFSRGVREIRKRLSQFLKVKKEAGQNVKMVYDHLVVEGEKFFLADDGESLVSGR
jgi:regulator of replication initiation timing